MYLKSKRGVAGVDDLVIVLLIALLSGASWGFYSAKKDLTKAHKTADQAVQTVGQLKIAETQTATDIQKERDLKTQQDKEKAQKAQLQGSYIVASTTALNQPTPNVPNALQFNNLALQSGDTLLPTTTAIGTQLGNSTGSQKDALIEDLQKQIADQKSTINDLGKKVDTQVTKITEDENKVGALTGTVSAQVTTITTVTDEKKTGLAKAAQEFAELSAKLGQWIMWSCIVIGALFGLYEYEKWSHSKTKTVLATTTAEHTATKAALAIATATVAAHVATISTLVNAPTPPTTTPVTKTETKPTS